MIAPARAAKSRHAGARSAVDNPQSSLRGLTKALPEEALRRLIAALFACLVGLCGIARAAPAPLPLDAYGRLPKVEMIGLAPSGERIAYVDVSGDDRQLFVRDLQNNILLQARLGNHKIRGIEWAGDSHIIIEISVTSTVFLENSEFFQTLVLNVGTKKDFGVFKNHPEIFPATFGYRGAINKDGHWYGLFVGFPLSKTRGFDPTIDSGAVNQLYRVDLDTGDVDVAARAYEHPREWAVAPDGGIAATAEYDETDGVWRLYAGAGSGSPIATLKQPYGEIGLAGLGPTPGTVMVAKSTPEVWTLSDGTHKPLMDDLPGFDLGYLVDPTTRHLVGVRVSGDIARQRFLDPVLGARLASLSKAFGGQVLIESLSADFKRLIVYTVGDGDPGAYWLVDGASAKAYGDTYPEVPDAAVATTRVVDYKAADGLDIHGILTLPVGRDPKNLPVVVMPHGGPEGHDTLGFDWWAQAFANQGYAVFQPNFRGSSGYGVEFRDAGFGQWGRKMQTDISDGLAELAREGVIDPKRACIVGASYGGYTALAGVTVQQGLYRCAVSYGGISDLNSLLNDAIPGDDDRSATGRYLRSFTGAKTNGDPSTIPLSPARLAARADAPILLMHGADDSVVKIGQSQEMERNLKAAGKPVEFVVIKGEDHWLSSDATRNAVLAASVAFVEKYDPAT
jgi:dipeptidyl aminopeptidase/acylaminoacyl peptidase